MERGSKGEAGEVEVDSCGDFGMEGLEVEVEGKEEEGFLLAPLELPLAIDDVWGFFDAEESLLLKCSQEFFFNKVQAGNPAQLFSSSSLIPHLYRCIRQHQHFFPGLFLIHFHSFSISFLL